jgi:hypothetical protein
MRRDKVAQLAARHPVSLTGTLDRASEEMPGDKGEDDGMPPHGGVLPVLRNQVQQPGRGRRLPVLDARRVHFRRPSRRHVPGRISLHHAAMIRNSVLSGEAKMDHVTLSVKLRQLAAANGSNRIALSCPRLTSIDPLTCLNDLY